jgi:hypothetical protein
MTPLSVHVLNATHKLPPKPSRFRRLLWLYGIPLFFMVALSVFGADVIRYLAS